MGLQVRKPGHDVEEEICVNQLVASEAVRRRIGHTPTGHPRPHRLHRSGDRLRIADRQRAGLADADERRAAGGAGRDLVLRRMDGRQRRGRRRAQHDAVDERQLQRRLGEARRGPGR